MSRVRKEQLRTLTQAEHDVLAQIVRSQNEPTVHVARAKSLLAVAAGKSYGEAAEAAGRKSNDAVAHLVSRFNENGLGALATRRGGGAQMVYKVAERERILREARRQPDPSQDGTTTWSLTTLQRSLRQAADGLPGVSTYTILSKRALAGQCPESPAQLIYNLQAVATHWNQAPTPFVWGGSRAARRARAHRRHHLLGGSGACTTRPILRRPSKLHQWLYPKQVTH